MGKISTEKKTYEFPSTHPLGTFLFWAKPCMHWDCGFLGVPLQTPLSRYIGRIIWGLLQSPFVVFFFISPIHYFFSYCTVWLDSPRRGEKKIHIDEIRNEKGEVTTDITEIQKTMTEYYEKL